MSESKIERQLVWYKKSKSNPERHYWNFLIVNSYDEANKIKQKLYDFLAPIVEEKPIDSGKIENSSLFYHLFCLVSTTPELDFSKIYQGKVRKDRRLEPRMTSNGWNDFIGKIYHGEI